MHTTRCLRDEHQVILRVLDCFELALRAAAPSAAALPARLDRQVFAPFLEFFQGFADRCHHCKEEDRLFPCLEQCGMPRDQGPIAVMIHEHQVGRSHIRAIADALSAADAGDADAVARVLEHSRRFLEGLRHHIMKEDHVLFEMADQIVAGPRVVSLANAYAQAEAAPGYRPTYDRCRAIADDLCARYGVVVPAGLSNPRPVSP